MSCTAASPYWLLPWISALGPPIVAIAAAIIATLISIRQWKTTAQQAVTARNKLKLDLFEKRLAIYEAARELISLMTMNTNLTALETREFVVKVRGAKWVLSEDISQYLMTSLFPKAIDIQMFNERLINPHPGDGTNWPAEKTSVLMWVAKQVDVVDEMFAPYLKLEH